MGLPQENEAAYHDGSPLFFADRLRGNLLVVHGSGDDNVHYQGTERLDQRAGRGQPAVHADGVPQPHPLHLRGRRAPACTSTRCSPGISSRTCPRAGGRARMRRCHLPGPADRSPGRPGRRWALEHPAPRRTSRPEPAGSVAPRDGTIETALIRRHHRVRLRRQRPVQHPLARPATRCLVPPRARPTRCLASRPRPARSTPPAVIASGPGAKKRASRWRRRHTGCRGRRAGDPWEEAALMGVQFRAVGQEPGWALDLLEGRWVRYVGDYGATRLYAASARQVRGPRRAPWSTTPSPRTAPRGSMTASREQPAGTR